MAARDEVVINIEVDVDDSKLDRLITKLQSLDTLSKDMANRFDKLSRASRDFNDNLGKSQTNLKNLNSEIDKTAGKFDDAAKKIDVTNKKLRDSDDILNKTNQTLDKHGNKMNRVNNRHRRFGRTIDRVIAPLKKFIMTLGKLSFIALIGQLGLFTVGLLTVKLALITGRAAVEVYNIALKGLSVTAAGVATAVSVAAAAMRQFNEAMLIPSVGGGMNRRGAQNAALLSRSLGSQTTGLLGGEATTSLVAAFAKAGVSRTATEGISRQLINLTGGDPAAVQAIAKAIGSKDSAELRSALSGAAGFRAGSLSEGLSTDQLLAALGSGSIVSDNYRGVSTGLAGTFIGTAKTEFSGMKNMFADMGQPLLDPFRESMMDMARIIRENFLGMSVLIQKFGADSFAPTLVTLVEKTMDFIRSNIFDHLENIKEMGEGFVGFFRSIRDFFHGMGAFLVQFEPAANVVLDMFRAMGAAGGGRGLFRSFSDLVVKNAVAFQQFGASIGNVFGAIFDLLKSGQSGFFGRLELFSEIMNTVAAKIIPAIGTLLDSLVPVLQQIPNVLNGLAVVIEGITPVIATLAAVLGKLMGAGPAGGILGGLGLLALMKPGRTYSGGRKLYDQILDIRTDPKKAARVARGAGLATGGLAFGFGAYRNATQGATAEGNLSMMAGGAMMGGMYGGVPGAIAGALGGAFMASVVNLLGENARKGRVRDVLDAGAAVAAETTFTGMDPSVARSRRKELGEVLAATRNIRTRKIDQANFLGQTLYEDDTNSLLFTIAQVGRMLAPYNPEQVEQEQKKLIDVTDPNFMRMKKYAEDNLFMDFSDFSRDELTDAFAPGGEIQQLIQEDAMQLATELATLEGNMRILARRTGLVEDEVLVLADALGIDLYNAVLNASGAAAVFLAQTLPLMDRNRAVLPGFNTSPLGQAELKATADAAFTSLVNADEITVDLVRDAVESFAAFDISTGTPADIAAFSAFSEINQKIMTVIKDPVKRAALRGEMQAGTAETAQMLADRHGISYSKIMSFDTHGAVGGGADGIIGSYDFEIAELNAFLNRQDAVRRGLNMSSGLAGSERLTVIEDLLGEDLSGSANLRRNILSEFGAAGDRFAADTDLSVIMKAAEEQGINTAQILVRTLAEEQLIGDDTVLSETRNSLLMEIRNGINEIDLPRRATPFINERGRVVDDGDYPSVAGI